VCAVLDWPLPKSTHVVRAFLGLASYYRSFIWDYGPITAPLTRLLRKEGFKWCPEAEAAFRALQCTLTMVLVLQLLAFDWEFVVECDASEVGFSAVLYQGDRPVAFFSKTIVPRHAKLATYEHELIGLVHAAKHWCPYLWGTPFFICTGHFSLKFLFDQKLSTIPQH
jgi:hypothetical protein